MLVIENHICLECGGCVALCPEAALFLGFLKIVCDDARCNLCGICIAFCPVAAINEGSSL